MMYGHNASFTDTVCHIFTFNTDLLFKRPQCLKWKTHRSESCFPMFTAETDIYHHLQLLSAHSTLRLAVEHMPEFTELWNIKNSINVTQIYVSTIYFILKKGLFLSKAKCFNYKLVIFWPLQHFRYQMHCPLRDPIVFTLVEYILVFQKGFDYRVCYYRMFLNITTINSSLPCVEFPGYSTVRFVVVLWLMLEFFCFSLYSNISHNTTTNLTVEYPGTSTHCKEEFIVCNI